MNRIFIIFLIGLFLLITSRFLVFDSFLSFHKSEFRENTFSQLNTLTEVIEISEKDLYKNKNGLEWKEENKELIINGIYYEVFSVLITNGVAIIHVLSDEAENELHRCFTSLNQKATTPFNQMIQFILSFVFVENSLSYCIQTFFSSKVQFSEITMIHLSDFQFELNKPPCLFYWT